MPRKTNITLRPIDTTELVAKVADLSARSKELAEQAAALEQQLKHVRGTREIKPQQSELYDQIHKLLSGTPLTLMQLVETTKAEVNKVKVVLLKMQREEAGIVNLGNQYRAVWFIPDKEMLVKLVKA